MSADANNTKPVDQPAAAGRAMPSRAFHAVKRCMDISAALVGLIAAGPLLLFCATWIWLTDGGPVLFRQWRVGHNGWLFCMYKFRTMRRDAERLQGAQFAQKNDPRVIPGCGWMRKSHVDELPQLINILVGHMSLIGPRPERPEMMEQLRADIPDIEMRLAARPGLTGLAQVRSGYSNDVDGARRKLAYDLEYLRTRSVLGEVRLLLQTIPKVWDRAAM